MFAIVEISGEQFKIDSAMKTLRVPYLKDASVGQEVVPDKVLMSQNDGGNVSLGGNIGFTATVQGHTRGEKVLVFHKKRRKGYRKTNGHTQRYTELAIQW
jgi:large subunit ribosomal protein L21